MGKWDEDTFRLLPRPCHNFLFLNKEPYHFGSLYQTNQLELFIKFLGPTLLGVAQNTEPAVLTGNRKMLGYFQKVQSLHFFLG